MKEYSRHVALELRPSAQGKMLGQRVYSRAHNSRVGILDVAVSSGMSTDPFKWGD